MPGSSRRRPSSASARRRPRLIYEAMECLGGNGYVEESALPRLYREAPVNAIWEGSGNVIALDILRAETREPEVAASVLERLMDGRPGPARRLRRGPGHRAGAPFPGRRGAGPLHRREAVRPGRRCGSRPLGPARDRRGLCPDPPGRPVPDDRRQRSRGGRESLAGAGFRGHIGNSADRSDLTCRAIINHLSRPAAVTGRPPLSPWQQGVRLFPLLGSRS